MQTQVSTTSMVYYRMVDNKLILMFSFTRVILKAIFLAREVEEAYIFSPESTFDG